LAQSSDGSTGIL